jgi:hypothetical protein
MPHGIQELAGHALRAELLDPIRTARYLLGPGFRGAVKSFDSGCQGLLIFRVDQHRVWRHFRDGRGSRRHDRAPCRHRFQ